jgi:hypothetical protein
MANLTNSIRQIPKATYVPLELPSRLPPIGRAVPKFGYVRQLNLQPGEVDLVQQSLKGAIATSSPGTVMADASFWLLLRQFEGSPLPAQLPSPSAFANIPESQLTAFGKALAKIRSQAVTQLQSSAEPRTAELTSPASTAHKLGSALNLLNTNVVANSVFASNITATPIGMLNLERLEMTPAGVERGELLATIPLAPKERTAVVQKEWSVIKQEFTSIVTDSLENYSETGVTENTELAQATNSQNTHSNQFNINATASGNYGGFVSASVSTAFTTQDQTSKSATESRKDAINTTRKASSRVKQSHKMTISTTTVSGTSETTTRMLENPSATDPIRIDYFSLMRKWYVALYRYGLRLTYDIAVPEPGGAMREIYAKLDALQKSLSAQFSFPIKHSDITADVMPGDSEPYYLVLADRYSVDAPPPPSPPLVVLQISVNFSDTLHIHPASFTVPDGYWISAIIYTDYHVEESPFQAQLLVDFSNGLIITSNTTANFDLCSGQSFLWHQSGAQSITLYYVTDDKPAGELSFAVQCVPTDTVVAQWQSAVWTALYNAAQSQFYAQQQAISAQIAALQNEINNVDTLTLRREENDEIMKCVLQWLLGPTFDFMPPEVVALFNSQGSDATTYGVGFTGNELSLSASQWTTMFTYQEMVKFINEAIEWENVVYYLYSYFWDVPTSWAFIRQIQHPDPMRQAFLRSGSARVVLTVRPGFEKAWTSFVELGDFGLILPPGHPYLTIAQQIEAYDSTNYPGIPAANPDGGGPIDDNTPQIGTTCATSLAVSNSPVSIAVADSTGFVVGASAIIDNFNTAWPASAMTQVQETQTIIGVPDSKHIIVQNLNYAHDGTGSPFPVVQAGAKGLLIAEWFEYTPTSGTDIAVTSNLATIN